MVDYTWEDFAEIFNLDESKICRDYLAEVPGKYCFNLELTLNYPRDCRFKRLCRKSQEKLYWDLLDYVKLHNSYIQHVDAYIEDCKDGLPHLHAILYCAINRPYSIEGVCNDIVNTYISQLPRRTVLNQHKYHYNHDYKVFKAPSILVQYQEVEDIKRTEHWENYIKKNI